MSFLKNHKRLCLFLILFSLSVFSMKGQNKSPFQVVWWNVENLFDCEHDSLKADHAFLPTSTRHWTNYRLTKKLHQIARTLVAIGKWNPPVIIGLCEVENENVLNLLTQRSALKSLHYRYVMTHSQDDRGIDIALLYQRDQFKLLKAERIHPPLNKKHPTRDILYVSGLILSQDTLDLFLCHLPSRLGGRTSFCQRNRMAELIKQKTDSIIQERERPNLIIMGDFNDLIHNETLSQMLQVKDPLTLHPEKNLLYHLYYHKVKQYGYGSYKYKGIWQMLDHILVSGLVITPENALHTQANDAHVARFPFLLEKDTKYGGNKPFRTYNGMRYQGGISDHLPLYVNLELDW